MSVLSSQELEECRVCFYLSSHVYQKVLKESTQAFLPREQSVFRMQTGVSTASFLSSVCLDNCLSASLFSFHSLTHSLTHGHTHS